MKPLISIGVPIYNEDRFLREALTSLQEQTYTNFEIIISDNASTDGTENICREFAASDNRIAYHRMKHNQGSSKNFAHVLSLSKGKYFMWAAGHDLWSKNFVSECVALLELTPSAVVAFGSTQWVNEKSEFIDKFWGWTDTRGMNVIARFFSVFWGNMNPILGVMRYSAIQNCKGVGMNTAGADLIILSELALQGYFAHATETSWSRREFRHGEDFKGRMQRYGSQQFAITKSFLGKLFPLARLPLELIKLVFFAPISLIEKLGIFIILIPSLPIKYLTARDRKA